MNKSYIIDIIYDDPEKDIFLREIFLQKDMIIKIMKHMYNRSFIETYKKLQNHNYFNIISIYGFMNCKNEFKQIKLKLMTDGICNEKDNDKIYLLIIKNINNNHINCSQIQLASIFYQIIITSLLLYADTSIIHTDINIENYGINYTNKEKKEYSISNTNINVIINLHGVKVDILDYDNPIIEDNNMKTYIFVNDIINTCMNFFNKYPIIPNEIYLKLDEELNNYSDIIEINGSMKKEVIKKVYEIIIKHIYPLCREEVMVVIDL